MTLTVVEVRALFNYFLMCSVVAEASARGTSTTIVVRRPAINWMRSFCARVCVTDILRYFCGSRSMRGATTLKLNAMCIR